jgi:hypothetical protein
MDEKPSRRLFDQKGEILWKIPLLFPPELFILGYKSKIK